MIASDIRVVVDVNSGDTVWVDSGRNLGEGEIANLDATCVADVGLDPRTGLTDDRPSDVVYIQQAVSTIAEERRLGSAANLPTNDDVEGDGIGGNRQ